MSLKAEEALPAYNIYAGDRLDLGRLASECQAILTAYAQWKLVASGYWSEDMYHSGHIAYYIANPAPGCWVMEARERNMILDDVTEEDIEEGRLNDDQVQAMWGQTLEEARNAEYRRIVAWSEGVDLNCTVEDMAAILYRAVCEDGGNEITEPDDHRGLLEV